MRKQLRDLLNTLRKLVEGIMDSRRSLRRRVDMSARNRGQQLAGIVCKLGNLGR